MVGYGLFLAQGLEGCIEQAFQVFILFRNKRDEIQEIAAKQSLEEWRSFINQNDFSEKEKMLGNLLSKIRRSDAIPTTVIDAIEEARVARNYIAHQFFKDTLPSFYSEPGQDRAIESLGEICLRIKGAFDLLAPIVQQKMDRYGYDQQYTEQFARNEVKNAERML